MKQSEKPMLRSTLQWRNAPTKSTNLSFQLVLQFTARIFNEIVTSQHPFRAIIYTTVRKKGYPWISYLIHLFIHPRSVFWQVHNLFQSEFSMKCYLVLLVSVSTLLSFPESHPGVAHVFFLIFPPRLSFLLFFPSIACFRKQFQRKKWPIKLAFFHFIAYTNFLSFLTLCVVLHHSSHDRSKWSSTSFSSTIFNPYRTNVENRVSS